MSAPQQQPVTVVLGSTGRIGRGTVTALLRAGHHVIAVVHDHAWTAGRSTVPRDGARLSVLVGDLVDERRAQDLLGAVRVTSLRIDNVVAALPGWYRGRRLLDTPVDELQTVVARRLRLHFVAARTFLPVLTAPDGRFLLVTSPAATTTLPELGGMSVAASAELTLGQVLAAEQPPDGARVRVLQVTTPVLTRRVPGADPTTRTAEEVGEMVAHLLARPPSRDPVVRWPYPEARPFATAADLVAALARGAEARDGGDASRAPGTMEPAR